MRKSKLRPQKEEEASLEKTLQEKVKEEPQNVKLYLELAQFYLNEERYDKADEVFAKAFEASDGDQEILEKWENTELRRRRQQIARTEDENTRKGLERQYLKRRSKVYQNRVKRYPSDFTIALRAGRALLSDQTLRQRHQGAANRQE